MATTTVTLPVQEETDIILQRYNIAQAHTLVYTYEELKQLGVEPEFLMALLSVFEDQQAFRKEAFQKFDLEVIIDYLKKTHLYYQTKKLLEIEQSIHLLVKSYPTAHPILLLLHSFYADYKNHLENHIEMEERELFPYIVRLEKQANGQETISKKPVISVQEFINQHHDTEKDLEEVRMAMVNYSPPADNQTLYRILLSQLQVFEKDMAVHALMEDEVVLPRALKLEQDFTRSN